MRLRELCEASERVASTAARLKKVEALSVCLRGMSDAELPIGVALLSGEARQGRIGVGYAVVKALDAPPARDAELTLEQVDEVLSRITALKGSGAAAKRSQALHELLARATALEQAFLFKLLLGELRQGALEGVMLDALARAFGVPVESVRRASMLTGRLELVAHAARAGRDALAALRLQLFRPLAPMLAQSADGVKEALSKLGRAAFEWKLDGARVQVHRRGDEVRVYTRSLNDVTSAVPEVVQSVHALPAHVLVLDGEVIALRPDGTPQPFQVTMRRFGRKLDVDAQRAELPLASFFFDLLHFDGRDLLDAPASERAQVLRTLVPEAQRVPRIETENAEEAEAFLEHALRTGHEGVVAKALGGGYEAGRRGGGWLKIKRALTLDLVVLAAEWGSGRRKGFLSNLHLGARAPDGGFVMLGKTFKGMTDEMLRWQTQRLLELEDRRDDYTVYVRPELLVEIAFDGVQKSSHYPGGLALRFARVKGYRPDKRIEEADEIGTVRAIAERQGTLG